MRQTRSSSNVFHLTNNACSIWLSTSQRIDGQNPRPTAQLSPQHLHQHGARRWCCRWCLFCGSGLDGAEVGGWDRSHGRMPQRAPRQPPQWSQSVSHLCGRPPTPDHLSLSWSCRHRAIAVVSFWPMRRAPSAPALQPQTACMHHPDMPHCRHRWCPGTRSQRCCIFDYLDMYRYVFPIMPWKLMAAKSQPILSRPPSPARRALDVWADGILRKSFSKAAKSPSKARLFSASCARTT